MPATKSRVDLILQTLLNAVAGAIVANGILPPTTQRFGQGWPVDAGQPDALVVRNAISDGGYVVMVDAGPARPSSTKWITQPVVTLADGTTARELDRRTQRVQVTVWGATSDMRDSIADAVDGALGTQDPDAMDLDLPDGTSVKISYVSGPNRRDEPVQDAQARRADILIDVDFGLLSAPLVAGTDYEDVDEMIGTVDVGGAHAIFSIP